MSLSFRISIAGSNLETKHLRTHSEATSNGMVRRFGLFWFGVMNLRRRSRASPVSSTLMIGSPVLLSFSPLG